jgi:hypothetical protein
LPTKILRPAAESVQDAARGHMALAAPKETRPPFLAPLDQMLSCVEEDGV